MLKKILTSLAGKEIRETLDKGLDLLDDKTNNADASFLKERIKHGKRVMFKHKINLTGTGSIISVALGMIGRDGIDHHSLIMLTIGVVFSTVMAFLTTRDRAAFNNVKESDCNG